MRKTTRENRWEVDLHVLYAIRFQGCVRFEQISEHVYDRMGKPKIYEGDHPWWRNVDRSLQRLRKRDIIKFTAARCWEIQ